MTANLFMRCVPSSSKQRQVARPTRIVAHRFGVRAALVLVSLVGVAPSMAGQTAGGLIARRAPRHDPSDTSVVAGGGGTPKVLRVRPFITDDARVVGAKLGQVESWARLDREAEQLWILGAYGPNNRVELTVGGVVGTERHKDGREGSYALPLLQGKYLVRPYATGRGPGLAIIAGPFLPHGRGAFVPAGYGRFAFAAASQAFGHEERVLVHLNVGTNYLRARNSVAGAPSGIDHQLVATWGTGTQIRAVGGMHVVAELFSGDPYVAGSGTAWQAGLRHFVSDRLQLDATVGDGIAGDTPLPRWVSAGVRIVLP